VLARELARVIQAQREAETKPETIVGRTFSTTLYGTHPYGIDPTADTYAAITRDDLVAFHRDWIRPDNATLVVVGDTTPGAVLPMLEKHFGDWQAPASAKPAKTLPTAAPPAAPRVFLVDKPGAIQSNILVGLAAPSTAAPNKLEMDTMNAVLAGTFTSRINMNLREDKHWAYGAQTQLRESKGPGLFLAVSQVQTDKTAESLAEVRRELDEFISTRPPTDKEVVDAKNSLTLTLPGSNETVSEVAGSYANILTFGLPESYYNDFVGAVQSLTSAQFAQAAKKLVNPKAVQWIVVGDLAKVEAKVRALNLGDVTVLDVDGKKLR